MIPYERSQGLKSNSIASYWFEELERGHKTEGTVAHGRFWDVAVGRGGLLVSGQL